MSEETTRQPRGEGAEGGFAPRPRTNKPKRRPCQFCMGKSVYIDYKDPRLAKYITEKGKIVTRRQTGLCAKHQRELTVAVKRARNMAMI